jgi:hypothetical protein
MAIDYKVVVKELTGAEYGVLIDLAPKVELECSGQR